MEKTGGKNSRGGPAIVVATTWISSWRTSYDDFSQADAASCIGTYPHNYLKWEQNRSGIGKKNREKILAKESSKDPKLRDFQNRLRAEIKKASAETPETQGTAEAVASKVNSPQADDRPLAKLESQEVRSLREALYSAISDVEHARQHLIQEPVDLVEARKAFAKASHNARVSGELLSEPRRRRDRERSHREEHAEELAALQLRAEEEGAEGARALLHYESLAEHMAAEAKEITLLESWVQALEEAHQEWRAAELKFSTLYKRLKAEETGRIIAWNYEPEARLERGHQLAGAAVEANNEVRIAVSRGSEAEKVCVEHLNHLSKSLGPIAGLHIGLTPTDCVSLCRTLHSWKFLITGPSRDDFRDALFRLIEPLALPSLCEALDEEILYHKGVLNELAGPRALLSLTPNSESSKKASRLWEETNEQLALARQARAEAGLLLFESLGEPENWKSWAHRGVELVQ